MFEAAAHATHVTQAADAMLLPKHTGPAQAPRGGPAIDTPWPAEMLDQLDYGLLIVRRDLSLVHANVPARSRLRLPDNPLSLRSVGPHWPADDAGLRRLAQATQAAADRMLRSTVQLHVGKEPIVLSVIPLRQRDERGQVLTLLALERERICTPLALEAFGRLQGLTAAEVGVLAELCAGREPMAIARKLGVSLSTVRTHVVAARTKLGVRSMREMLIGVARLPPISGVLHG